MVKKRSNIFKNVNLQQNEYQTRR